MHYSYLESLGLTKLKTFYRLMPESMSKNVARLIRGPLNFFNARKYSSEVFANVEAYCMFVGYPRSGHTLIAALLDAHPNIIIANEMNALNYVDRGLNQTQLFSLLLNNSQSFARRGSNWTGYSYAVPGQWQGRFNELRCIGDKKGGASARRLSHQPDLLNKLATVVNKELKVIHVVRNPYDNIATISIKKQFSLPEAIEFYFYSAAGVIQTRQLLPRSSFLTIRYETFVKDPRRNLELLCTYLGQEAPPDYLESCAGTVFESPRRSRDKISWDRRSIEQVRQFIRENRYDFLEDYTFED